MGAGSAESPPRGAAVNSGAMREIGKGRCQSGRDRAGIVLELCWNCAGIVRGGAGSLLLVCAVLCLAPRGRSSRVSSSVRCLKIII